MGQASAISIKRFLRKTFFLGEVIGSFKRARLVFSFEKLVVLVASIRNFWVEISFLGDRLFQTNAKNFYFWKISFFQISIRHFLSRMFFFWGGPGAGQKMKFSLMISSVNVSKSASSVGSTTDVIMKKKIKTFFGRKKIRESTAKDREWGSRKTNTLFSDLWCQNLSKGSKFSIIRLTQLVAAYFDECNVEKPSCP